MEAGRGAVESNAAGGAKALAKNAHGLAHRAQSGGQQDERRKASLKTVDAALALYSSSLSEAKDRAAGVLHRRGIGAICQIFYEVVERCISAASRHLEDLAVAAVAAPYRGAVQIGIAARHQAGKRLVAIERVNVVEVHQHR